MLWWENYPMCKTIRHEQSAVTDKPNTIWIEQYKKIKSKIVIITKTGQHKHRLLNWVRPHAFNAQSFHAWGQSCIVTKGTKCMQNLSCMESVTFPYRQNPLCRFRKTVSALKRIQKYNFVVPTQVKFSFFSSCCQRWLFTSSLINVFYLDIAMRVLGLNMHSIFANER